MSGSAKRSTYDSSVVEVKAKFQCEFRRFSLKRSPEKQFDDFYTLVKDSFHLPDDFSFKVFYNDPRNEDILPITNDENLFYALGISSLLRIFVHRKEDVMEKDMMERKKKEKKRILSRNLHISDPTRFRQVCAILDADFLPDSVRRVKLMKPSPDQPLGFYIRDKLTMRVTPEGSKNVSGIFISRLVPNGLAEGTGLLAVGDEIQEINGIEVEGKSLDEATDMMIANSNNLVLTVVPASQPPLTPQTQHRSSNKVRHVMKENSLVKAQYKLSKSCDDILEHIPLTH